LGVEEHPSKSGRIPGAERKRVTALFLDLSGYTSMTEKLDPEEVKEITGSIFDGIRRVIAKYEGFIERFAGDGVLALFGVPKAHEDDPVRAILAAKEIHGFVDSLSPRYEPKLGRALSMHSGINTGLAVTADVNLEKGTHGVTGDAINVAARLSDMATAGEILVGPETRRASKRRFNFEKLEPAKFKGKAEPIPVYKLISAKTHDSLSGEGRQIFSEMVGRDRELSRLELQVLKAINGDGSVVNVVGEAGIGKSRFIAELKRRDVMKRTTLLEGRAISIGKNLSFHPIIDLFKQWAKIAEDDPEAKAFDKLENTIQAVHPRETDEILPFVAILMGMKLTGRHADRVRGIQGEALEKLIVKNMRELVIKGSELRPTVVIMEDLHWADTSSIELLEVLYRLSEKHRLIFINVFRPGYLEDREAKIASIGQRLPVYYVEIEILPLEKNDSQLLIQNMLKIKGLPYSVMDRIVDRAGGNPYFIEEVVRSLIDEGAVVRKEGGFEATDLIRNVVIPPGINDVLIARIDRLEEGTRELVKVASVIGRNFFDRIIKDVAGSITDVDSRLLYLKDIQLIRDRMRMQEVEYLFKHALAQEAAYESTLLQQRKALHRKVAQSIEKVFQERLQEFYGMLAYHYSKGEDLEKAEEYMIKAGKEALRASASSEALSYFQEALRLYVDRYGERADPAKLTAFKKNLITAHYNRGHHSEVVSYIDEILESKGYRSPRSKAALALRAIFDFIAIAAFFYVPMHRKPRIPDSEELEDLNLRLRRCQSLLLVDNSRFFVETVSLIKIVLTLDPRKLPEGVKWAASSAAILYVTGLYALSEKALQRAEAIAVAKNQTESIYIAFHRSSHALFSGLWNLAPAFDPAMPDSALRAGEFYEATLYLSMQGQMKAEQGLFEDADLSAEKQRWIAESYDYNGARVSYRYVKAFTAIRKGDLHDALVQAEEGFLLTDRAALNATKLAFLGFNAMAEVLHGHPETAMSTVREGEVLLTAQRTVVPTYLIPFVVGRLLVHLQLLRDALQSGNAPEIKQRKKPAYRLAKQAVRASRKFAPFRTWILRLMGDYHWLIGKQGKALKWWKKSIVKGQSLGARVDLSRTYFEVGKHLLEPQSKTKHLNGIDGKGYLEKARILFIEMDLQRDLDELDRFLT